MQLGANLNHDVGYMDFGLSGSLAEVVLVAEFIARNRRLLAEIEVSDETLAVDVLEAVGPGGDFLGQRHTRRNLRGNQWRAQLLNRASYDRWFEGGGLDVTEKARRRALELLATHEAPALPAELVARLDAVVPAG
jgi:trimethylamine--corrinoid protein Co-methyltransferase